MPTYRPPAGFYQAENVNYPQSPAFTEGAVDLLGNPAGVGTNMSGQLYSDPTSARPSFASEAPPSPMQSTPGVTRLTPGRQTPFSRADAQALAALDPRALEEANALAARPESKPALITGSFGGKSFEMQPSARVDRNALARLYQQAEARKGQEREDAVRGQEQGGRERLVSIPGQQLNEREKIRVDADAKKQASAQEFERPERDARVASSQSQTTIAGQEAGRKGQEFAERVTPGQQAIDDQLAKAESSPFAATPAGRAAILDLRKRSTAGRQLPTETNRALAEGASPAPDIGTAAAEVMADPGIAALIERAKQTEAGFLTGSRGRATGAAARQLAERAIRARLARSGIPPEEAQQLISSVLGAASAAPQPWRVGSFSGTMQ